ncbi:inner membrane protein YrbG [bacterium BMS3Bbin02]|nr:inner membrane protein YrbG [bacterium BMS3Bbin02]
MFIAILSTLAGLVLLILAADRLVVAAVRLSKALGVSAVLIGALVVGLGTSLPELLVSSLLAREGKLDEAVANVVGSNTANVTLVLGLAALLTVISSERRILYREGILMVVAVSGYALTLSDGRVEAWEGGALLFGLLIALYLMVTWSLKDADAANEAIVEVEEMLGNDTSTQREVITGIVAIVVTVGAAQLLLTGATTIGTEVGLSATVLGVMLGVGTSLPEMATALAAARRKQADLVIGNVLGSNIFNSLAVGGVAALVGQGVLTEVDGPLLIVMVGTAIVAGLFARSGGRVVRFEGALLMFAFVGFFVLTL